MSILPLQNADVEEFANCVPVMMWSSSSSGTRDWFNRGWLEFRGRDAGEETGVGWTEGVHPQDLAKTLEVSRLAYQKQQPFETEYRLRRRDGVYRWILAKANPFRHEGEFAGFLGCCFDITDHHTNEEKLGDALIEREALLREVHHRVKNNLQTLMALMRFMRRSASADGREVLDILNLRLVTMALVQKHLHSADTITEVSAAGMLDAILPELADMGVDMSLRLDRGADDLVLPGQATAYLGLAVSEGILLFSQGRSQACTISFRSQDRLRHIVMAGQGGSVTDSDVLLGQRLVRQYARGAGALVDIGETQDGPTLTLTFQAG